MTATAQADWLLHSLEFCPAAGANDRANPAAGCAYRGKEQVNELASGKRRDMTESSSGAHLLLDAAIILPPSAHQAGHGGYLQ